jgi:hypothetical protein
VEAEAEASERAGGWLRKALTPASRKARGPAAAAAARAMPPASEVKGSEVKWSATLTPEGTAFQGEIQYDKS